MIHMDTSTPVGAAQIHELVGQEELCDGLHELRADASEVVGVEVYAVRAPWELGA